MQKNWMGWWVSWSQPSQSVGSLEACPLDEDQASLLGMGSASHPESTHQPRPPANLFCVSPVMTPPSPRFY